MSKKNILIIAYKFPPMGGVGSRRWAKFSKYLAKNGYQVHVLSARYPYIDKNNWSHETKNSNIHLHTFNGKYPTWLLHEGTGRIAKIFKRYANYILKKMLFPLDIAQHDAKPILANAKKIISQYNIVNVIASGHPVSINYISAYLKIDLPHIHLIQDYRDNWNDLKIYGFGNQEGFTFFSQKEKSAYKEFFTLFYSDIILNVSQDLTKQLQIKHPLLKEKFITLTNGYDEDDFQDISATRNGFNMIYTGSLFNHRMEAIELILDAILELDDPFINEHFQLILYTNYDAARLHSKYRALLQKNIFFHSFVSPKEVVRKTAMSYCALSINAKLAPYAFGTKVFDYMALKKRIIHISEGGALFEILEKKNQFVCRYNKEEVKSMLIKLKRDYLSQDNIDKVDYDQYSIQMITKKLESLFR